MELECRFCNTTFKNKCARLYHQRNAKYCLKLQGIESTNYVCSYCNKSLCEKRMLEIHEEKCRDSENILNKNLEKQYKGNIEELEKKCKSTEEQLLSLQQKYHSCKYTILKLQKKQRTICMKK